MDFRDKERGCFNGERLAHEYKQYVVVVAVVVVVVVVSVIVFVVVVRKNMRKTIAMTTE